MSDPARSPGTFREALAPLRPLYLLDVLTALTVGMVPPILPLLAADWGLSTVGVGFVNTVYAVGRLTGSYPASEMRARWGTRTAVFFGLAGLVVGSIGCGLAPTFPLFLAARFVMGVGASAAFLAVFAEILEAAPAAWRGRLGNAFEGMAILSLAVGGIVAAGLARAGGWRAVFLGVGLVLLLGFGAWGPLGRQPGPPAEPPTDAARRAPEPGTRTLAPVHVAAFTLALTWAGLFATLAPLLGHGRYGLSAGALGFALGAGYVAEVSGLVVLGAVIDRVRREPLFLAGAVSVAAGGLTLAAGAHPGVFVTGLMLVGAGFAVWMIPATVLVDRAGTPIPPGRLAVFRIGMDLGMILGPFLLGSLAEASSDRLAVGAAGFVLVGGALALARR